MVLVSRQRTNHSSSAGGARCKNRAMRAEGEPRESTLASGATTSWGHNTLTPCDWADGLRSARKREGRAAIPAICSKSLVVGSEAGNGCRWRARQPSVLALDACRGQVSPSVLRRLHLVVGHLAELTGVLRLQSRRLEIAHGRLERRPHESPRRGAADGPRQWNSWLGGD